jgi:hypothetical protein
MVNLFFGLAAIASAQSAGAEVSSNKADVEAVRAAVLDYVESLYKVRPDLVAHSVSPDLAKLGHHRDKDGRSKWPSMSYSELYSLAAKYNATGRVPADAAKKIQVLDVQPNIANAKLEAHWGIDYLLLTKGADGRWQIRQVLWEEVPRDKKAK